MLLGSDAGLEGLIPPCLPAGPRYGSISQIDETKIDQVENMLSCAIFLPVGGRCLMRVVVVGSHFCEVACLPLQAQAGELNPAAEHPDRSLTRQLPHCGHLRATWVAIGPQCRKLPYRKLKSLPGNDQT